MNKRNSTPNQNQIAERQASLSRRRFLRGLGACMALPAFESFSPLRLLGTPATTPAGEAATTAPVRMAFLQVPNGVILNNWWPAGDGGSDFALSPTLQPLAKIKHELQVISGLDDLSANAGADGGGDHARAGGTFLTGVRIKKTSGADIYAGTSIDQVVAEKIGHLTRFRSLELSCEPNNRKSGDCDSGYSCAYEYNMAWRSPTQPLAPEVNPRLVFERLFGAGSPDQRLQNLKQRQAEERSILDFVMADARAINAKMNGRDQQKLDQYLTSVREIEQRIERAERMPAPELQIDTPPGLPTNTAEHIQLMFDMLLLAFQTDSTRVATMLISKEGSDRVFPDIGVMGGHHTMSHHRGNSELITQLAQIDLWYTQQLAKFLEKMEATKDVDGNSLLHNSMILYGSGNADGNRHTHFDLPILVAGSGGGASRRAVMSRWTRNRSRICSSTWLTTWERKALNDWAIPRAG
ncbi:MAG: DUF1552 domain-containing protein [Verrucomicrobiota bacterium]